ncbi:hypothetical protein N6N72_08935, partial [Escherichia albertii]|uniref:hypothetical protein n=1 Tax=Escherichia albertii TaxID=208962 RepID=UPI0021D45897
SGLHVSCNILNLQFFVGRIRRSRRIRHDKAHIVICLRPALRVFFSPEEKLPDALCLSGLHVSCNILNLQFFVGRIRRSRRIRHDKAHIVICLRARSAGLFSPEEKLPDALCLSGLHVSCNILNLQFFAGRIRRSRRIRHDKAHIVICLRPALRVFFSPKAR